MRRSGYLLVFALIACGPMACGAILGVESIGIDPDDAGSTPVPTAKVDASPGDAPSGIDAGPCTAGASRACNTHPQDGVGPCAAGTQTCVGNVWGPCSGDVGPAEESCDNVDRNCNGVPGVDEPAPPPPAGTENCARMFKCTAAKRGPLFYRTGVGFTNVAGADTVWTAYAARGDFSDMTFPPGTFRIARDPTGTKIGPVTVASTCCATGCPTANTIFDGQGQYYTLPPGN